MVRDWSPKPVASEFDSHIPCEARLRVRLPPGDLAVLGKLNWQSLAITFRSSVGRASDS